MSEENDNLFYEAIGNTLENNKKQINKLEKQNTKLKKHNKSLEERIEKAIELIKNRATDENEDIGINLYASDSFELLEILEKKEV